jgi:hypothetical protein
MKDTVKKLQSFITFEHPIHLDYITQQFSNTQQKFQKVVPEWSISATRQKLIADYWFIYVIRHFAIILGLPALLFYLIPGNFELQNLLGVFMAGFLSFPVLYLFVYRPSFGAAYLPRLETIKEAYERKELEHLEKCRRSQLSNLALCLVFYVFDKACSMNKLQPNDQYAGILIRLYGVDQGSLKKNLELIFSNAAKRKSLTDRKITEIRNRFSEAYNFFEEMNFPEGVSILKQLESKLTST